MTGHIHCCDELDYDAVAERAVQDYLASLETEQALAKALTRWMDRAEPPDGWGWTARTILAMLREQL